jgi:lipopolysaccharide export LptBFGC system permease protein LptF
MVTVAFHFVVTVAHAAAHMRLHIDMNLWQNAYIMLVIVVLPLLSAYLLWRRERAGFLLLCGSMLGALVFGVYYHLLAAGIDNVGSLASSVWAPPFQITAVLLAMTEAGGALIGAVGAFRK